MPPGEPVPPAQEAGAAAVTPALLRRWPLPAPDEQGDKHDRGTVLVVGGARSTPGAVLLAGLAALRAGAGRLSVSTVASTSVAIGVALPEALVQGLAEDGEGRLDPGCAEQVLTACGSAAAVVLGPGLLGSDLARELLEAVLPGLTDGHLLLDAVALTALAGAPQLLAGLEGRVVLTPNGGELAALLQGSEREGEDAAREVAERYGAVVAARGTVACPGGRVFRDEAGGIGLGTSGSGDVLAGVVGGLLARGLRAGPGRRVGAVRPRRRRRPAGRPGRPGRLPGPRAARRGAPGPGRPDRLSTGPETGSVAS